MKKKYELSIANQRATERRILESDTGMKFDVSFRPAILSRVYYKTWSNLQKQLYEKLPKYTEIILNSQNGIAITPDDDNFLNEFVKITDDSMRAGTDLIMYALKANGYDDLEEEELFTHFSEQGLSLAVNYVMGIDQLSKKKG